MALAGGVGAHAYYCNYRYSDYKREIYSKLFTDVNKSDNPLLQLRGYQDLNGNF